MPSGKADPEVTLHPTLDIPDLSEADTAHDAVAVGVVPFVGVTVKYVVVLYGGHVMFGAAVSTF